MTDPLKREIEELLTGSVRYTAFKVPLLTFVIAFAVMCSGIASAATLSKAFAGDYLAEFGDRMPAALKVEQQRLAAALRSAGAPVGAVAAVGILTERQPGTDS